MRLRFAILLLVVGCAQAGVDVAPDPYANVPYQAFREAWSIYPELVDKNFEHDQEAFVSVRFKMDQPGPYAEHAEYSFSFRSVHRGLLYFESEEVEALYSRAYEHSLLFQLARAAADSSDPTIKIPQLSIRSAVLHSSKCPAVRDAVRSLAKLKFEPFDPDASTYLHPPIYEFELLDGTSRMKLEVTDWDHALARWADSTMTALETCSKQ